MQWDFTIVQKNISSITPDFLEFLYFGTLKLQIKVRFNKFQCYTLLGNFDRSVFDIT